MELRLKNIGCLDVTTMSTEELELEQELLAVVIGMFHNTNLSQDAVKEVLTQYQERSTKIQNEIFERSVLV